MNRTALPALFTVVVLLLPLAAMPETADPRGLIVHEWGTFTSVAGRNGEPVGWRSYGGPSDLPCFVERFEGFKGGVFATVRMETPVLYFYGERDSAANVKVGFPKGTITEWYPKAVTGRPYNNIAWPNIRIVPEQSADFPAGGDSHYYAARETDAAALEVASQKEKFLFYRGVGTFPLPIAAKATADGKIEIKRLSRDAVDGLILFENRAGQRSYKILGSLASGSEMIIDTQSLEGNWEGLLRDLERILTAKGLYSREAHAMIETWRESWFEEGARLFYIVPEPAIESILPLSIVPAPSRVVRVFVGRMELITPVVQQEVQQAIASNDRPTLEKYGRFLEPIAQRMGVRSALLDQVYARYFSNPNACVR
jgi:hypothetical protein